MEGVSPLINEKGELASSDVEKFEVLNEFFDLVFMASQASHASCIPDLPSSGLGSKIPTSERVE